MIEKQKIIQIKTYKELSKQANIVDIASTLQKRQEKMLEDNANLKVRCHELEQSLFREKKMNLKSYKKNILKF